jgi:amino acid transporter
MLWIYDIPLWLLATLILLVCIAYAVGAVTLVRRRNWWLKGDDNGVAAALHAFVGVLYAVALGLLVVSTQDANSDVEAAVTREANATGDLFRAMAGLEPANRDRMQRELGAYVLLVVNDEWPATQRAEMSMRTWTAIDRLSREIYTFQPSTPREERAAPELTHEIEKVLDARRDRLFLGQRGVGAVTWTIIILGGLITIGFASFFGMENARAQTFLTALAASMFGLMIFLILAMDHPLWGKVSVEPGPFRDLESSFVRMRAEQAAMPAPVTAAPPVR